MEIDKIEPCFIPENKQSNNVGLCLNLLSEIGNSILSLIKNNNSNFESLNCQLENLNCSINNLSSNEYKVYASLASTNPMAVAAEYPENIDNDTILLYKTIKVTFMDMLNPNMIVLFKGLPFTYIPNIPVKFMDNNNYAHIVTVGNINTPLLSNEIVKNYPYPALYVGNYVILKPTQQTLDDFKNGLLN